MACKTGGSRSWLGAWRRARPGPRFAVQRGLVGGGQRRFQSPGRDDPARGASALSRMVCADRMGAGLRLDTEAIAEGILEREAGPRALLNLGHTFGHALEAETGFGGTLLHGEAVSIGLVLAAELSVALGRLDVVASSRLRHHLSKAGLPVSMTAIPGAPFEASRLMAHMAHDKKVEDGQLTFILLEAIGRAVIARGVPMDAVAAVLKADGARLT